MVDEQTVRGHRDKRSKPAVTEKCDTAAMFKEHVNSCYTLPPLFFPAAVGSLTPTQVPGANSVEPMN